MLTKSCPVQVKAPQGADDGTFEAIVSVFGNVDTYGDKVLPGAFTDTLAEWGAKGDPIPVLWSHRSEDPDYHIGHVVEAKETEAGLWVRGQLDLESAKAAQVYRLLKGRRVTQFSFAYDVLDGAMVEAEGEKFYELRKLKLYEVGPTLIGVNQQTELLGVKAVSELAGEVASGHLEVTTLRNLHKALGKVLSAHNADDDTAKASEPAKDEEPSVVKSEEPMRCAPASVTSDLLAVASLDIAS